MGEWTHRSIFFLTSALAGGEWSASRSCRFTPGESATGTHWIGGWVGRRAGMDVEKRTFLTLPGHELRPLARPTRSQSLYRIRYPGSLENWSVHKFIDASPSINWYHFVKSYSFRALKNQENPQAVIYLVEVSTEYFQNRPRHCLSHLLHTEG
jgi:hypothetical protein